MTTTTTTTLMEFWNPTLLIYNNLNQEQMNKATIILMKTRPNYFKAKISKPTLTTTS